MQKGRGYRAKQPLLLLLLLLLLQEAGLAASDVPGADCHRPQGTDPCQLVSTGQPGDTVSMGLGLRDLGCVLCCPLDSFSDSKRRYRRHSLRAGQHWSTLRHCGCRADKSRSWDGEAGGRLGQSS
jgi:hypothetical protein